MTWKKILKMSSAPEVIRVDGEYYALNFEKPITKRGFYSYLPLVNYSEMRLIKDKDEFLNQQDIELDIEEADFYATIRGANEDKGLKETYFRLKNQ
ncbi:hypothetical protein QKV95_gp122 [Poseidoniales virus YSH_150918]|uniref:Uncharacterized protein n=1 Tax=Poseidoniales virus YSH_150918 TaxID=3071324 RepID=A0A976UB28_9CAUD|nr:hypothetical protein QKV95_gp122 [Yangshan Harbor Poseidoniales virus]UVF62599.1 hypothetical protein [Poseidoniales virus YSH_150918]